MQPAVDCFGLSIVWWVVAALPAGLDKFGVISYPSKQGFWVFWTCENISTFCYLQVYDLLHLSAYSCLLKAFHILVPCKIGSHASAGFLKWLVWLESSVCDIALLLKKLHPYLLADGRMLLLLHCIMQQNLKQRTDSLAFYATGLASKHQPELSMPTLFVHVKPTQILTCSATIIFKSWNKAGKGQRNHEHPTRCTLKNCCTSKTTSEVVCVENSHPKMLSHSVSSSVCLNLRTNLCNPELWKTTPLQVWYGKHITNDPTWEPTFAIQDTKWPDHCKYVTGNTSQTPFSITHQNIPQNKHILLRDSVCTLRKLKIGATVPRVRFAHDAVMWIHCWDLKSGVGWVAWNVSCVLTWLPERTSASALSHVVSHCML